MNYWLLKSEPDAYSWENLNEQKEGTWDGVRNYQARNNLRDMKKGDLALFYHSNIGKEIVGIATISKEHFPDPTIDDERWLAIKVKPKKAFKRPVTLIEMKADPMLINLPLIKHSRLSVMPISEEDFNYIIKLSNS